MAASAGSPPPPIRNEWVKALITNSVSLVLTPLTIGLTFFFTTTFQSPKPSIEESSSVLFYDPIPLGKELQVALKKNPTTAAHLREAILAAPAAADDPDCVEWMKTFEWVQECSQKVHGALGEITDQAKSALENPFTRTPEVSKGITSDLAAIKSIEHAIQVADETPSTSRTGFFQATVGVYNSGGSDGVIKSMAKFEFDAGSVSLGSKTWTPVKSHSFSEVKFSSWNIEATEEKTAREELQRRIKNHQEVRGHLKIDVSEKTIATDLTLSNQD